MKTVKDYYNKLTSNWSDAYYAEKKESGIVKKFIDCYNDAGTFSPKILDLGCGIGYDTKILNELKAKTVSIDFSENAISVAKKLMPEYKFFVGDIKEPLENFGKFDGAICLDTIKHIDAKDVKKVFENVAKVLNEGALFLVSATNGRGKDIKNSIVSIDNMQFDQNINCYMADEITAFAYPFLKLVDMWKFDDDDEIYYVFRK